MSEAIGDWRWDKRTARLSLTVVAEHLANSLSGQWALGDLDKIVDGFSKRRIERALEEDESGILIELTLADGQEVQLVGAAVEEGNAQGIILEITPLPDQDSTAMNVGPALVPVFQPIVCLRQRRTIGFEALARWRGNDDSLSSGALDDQALATNMLIASAEALSALQLAHDDPDLFMHVNLTGVDLMDDMLVALVSALNTGQNLKDGSLRLELTEQAALRDTDKALSTVHALKAAGAGLVLDDFGSGHSSFLWLADLPADSLKVDADLIAQSQNPRVQTILEAVTLMAKRLGMKTTAEGVEDTAILPLLLQLGFDHAQGFALGRPMPFDEAKAFLLSR
ncbi:MAG: EAL domain-containing protein [Henriciella sp.]|jgi:EAL domain-containing protein (putative c-di-GMP-specific phosphodiesterase class I)